MLFNRVTSGGLKEGTDARACLSPPRPCCASSPSSCLHRFLSLRKVFEGAVGSQVGPSSRPVSGFTNAEFRDESLILTRSPRSISISIPIAQVGWPCPKVTFEIGMARSWLHQRRLLQVKEDFPAFFKLYILVSALPILLF